MFLLNLSIGFRWTIREWRSVHASQAWMPLIQDLIKHDAEITLGTVGLKGVNFIGTYTLLFVLTNYTILTGPVLGQLLRVMIYRVDCGGV